jgi:toxin-antitoxin system PIN domain toxin
LLDVNVLIASIDSEHVAHKRVHAWLGEFAGEPWATCAITEAGFVRIVSNPIFHKRPVSMQEACRLLSELAQRPDHRFWPMDISFAEAVAPFQDRLYGHRQVSDAYLLGLAIRNKGRLVTLDRAIEAMAGAELARYLTVLR